MELILFYLFIFWLCWVFVVTCGLSLVVASRRYSSLRCVGSVVAGNGPNCSAACGIFPEQGLNLHWQADSYLLHHQGSPKAHTSKH